MPSSRHTGRSKGAHKPRQPTPKALTTPAPSRAPDPAVKVFEERAPVYRGFDDESSSKAWADIIRSLLRDQCKHMPSIVQYHLVKSKISRKLYTHISWPKGETASDLIQMVIDWFPTHIFKARQRTKTAANLSNAKPVVQSASPKESLPAKPSPVQSKDKVVDTAPMPHSEQVDIKGVTALLDGAKRCVEISQTKTRLADFPAATMAAPLSVSLPPITVEGLVCRPCSWLEGVTVGDTVVRAAVNSVAEISVITSEAAKKLGLTILMGGQQHRNPTCLKAPPTVVGYVEAPVGVTGRKKRWVRAEVLEEPQPWDLLLGEAPVLTRDVIPNAPAKRKCRRTQKRKGPLTTSAESPSDETRDSHGESQILAVKKAVVAVDNSGAKAVVDGAITSDFKTAAENDKSKRVEDERIADSPLQAFAKRKRPLAGTGYTFCNTPQTEASAAIPIVGAKGSQCLANADALFEARPVHSYTDDEGSSDSDYSLVDDMLITEIRPDTGEIVCRRVPITYKSSASQN